MGIEEKKKKLFLLDAMALIYRAYFAMIKAPRMNSKGFNTSAVVGFINSLFDILVSQKPTHIAVANDAAGPTLREEEYVFYKANRQETPEDIIKSIPYVEKLLDAMNIPVISMEGYEADDIIGTLARRAEKNNFVTYIVSGDKDLGQLTTENIFIYKPAIGGLGHEILGASDICTKYRIKKPEQLIDILALWGDKTDNIPGVHGIGEKQAIELISEWGSVENLYENINSIKESQRKKLLENKENAFISKKLATINTDVPLNVDFETFIVNSPNIDILKEIFEELEFKAISQRVFKYYEDFFNIKNENIYKDKVLKDIHTTEHEYILVTDYEKVRELADYLEKYNEISFDVETTGLDANNCEIVGISFCVEPHKAWYVGLPEIYYDAHKFLQCFKNVFENPDIVKIGQNLKFDITVLKWYDINVKGPLFDTMIAHYLLEPEIKHNLDFLSEKYLNYKTIPIESLIGKKGKDQLNMRDVVLDVVKEYAAEDADVAFQLKQVFSEKIKEKKLEKLFYEIESPLIYVLSTMEFEGVTISKDFLSDYSKQLDEEIKNVEKEIFQLSGVEFNISSPKQLGEILFERLCIDENVKKTKTKQYSTSEETLQKLKFKHPIIEKILEYRSLTKLKTTYVDALPRMINQRTNRVHSTFNQAITSTGRLSSNNPNLQNIPVRTEKGKEIRKAIIPRNSDYVILSADYSQIELRIIASLSEDENMIEAFKSGIDIHSMTASKLYGVSLNSITDEMRRKAKVVNFGIIYGISAYGLAERIGIPRREAAEIIKQYFEKFPAIKKYMEKQIQFARENGYVETITGRKRYLKDINSQNATIRSFAERNAINTPIQGSAADLIKIAMVNIYNEFEKKKLRSKMIIQVHDELVFDVYLPELENVKNIVMDKMINAWKFKVPLEVDIKYGSNWLEAH